MYLHLLTDRVHRHAQLPALLVMSQDSQLKYTAHSVREVENFYRTLRCRIQPHYG